MSVYRDKGSVLNNTQEQVPRLDLPSEAHEDDGVGEEGSGHRARDGRLVFCGDVGDGCQRQSPVGDLSSLNF